VIQQETYYVSYNSVTKCFSLSQAQFSDLSDENNGFGHCHDSRISSAKTCFKVRGPPEPLYPLFCHIFFDLLSMSLSDETADTDPSNFENSV